MYYEVSFSRVNCYYGKPGGTWPQYLRHFLPCFLFEITEGPGFHWDVESIYTCPKGLESKNRIAEAGIYEIVPIRSGCPVLTERGNVKRAENHRKSYI